MGGHLAEGIIAQGGATPLPDCPPKRPPTGRIPTWRSTTVEVVIEANPAVSRP